MRKLDIGTVVTVDFPEVPKEDRQCTTGVVIERRIKFRGTKLEKILVTIAFDRPYIKPNKVFLSNIKHITMNENSKKIKILRKEK